MYAIHYFLYYQAFDDSVLDLSSIAHRYWLFEVDKITKDFIITYYNNMRWNI